IVEKMVKKTFSGFKTAWMLQDRDDPIALARKWRNERTARWTSRKAEKLKHMKSAVAAYIASHVRDPTMLLDAAYLSDEASPDSADEAGLESQDDWIIRMAQADKVNPGQQGRISGMYLELTDAFHDLQDLWYASLSPKEQARFQYTRMTTGPQRYTLDLPVLAPYDFGIADSWWK
ncbi:hypothetical protein C8J56DRAFT_730501, partial [Mycena floridula]